MKRFTFTTLILLLGVVAAVSATEAFCPGGTNPQTRILYCEGFETATTPFPDDFIGGRASTGDAAVGTGAMVTRAVPGGTGTYGGAGWAATSSISSRYYFKFKDGYLLPVGENWNHGPDLRANGECSLQFMPDWTMTTAPNLKMLTNCPGTGFVRFANNMGNITLRNNRWYLAELQVIMNTPGLSDGIVRLWVDEVLLLEYTNVNMRGSSNIQFTSGLTYNTYTHRLQPSWPQKMLFDSIVISNGSYIGPATNENPRGTADLQSPYPNYIAYQAMVGHRPGSDCWVSPGVTGGGFDAAWRTAATTLQVDITNGEYTNTCNANADRAMRVEANATHRGGGVYYSIGSLIHPQLSLHGSVYLPSSNNYAQIFALAGLTKYDVDNFQPGGTDWAKYLALGIVDNQWAIVQRNSDVQTTSVLAGPVTYNAWNEFELVFHQNQTVSLMINREWVLKYVAPPASIDWAWNEAPGIVTDSRKAVYGVLHSNLTTPFVVYYDDVDVTGPSSWSCEGWHPSSCPFAAEEQPADVTPPTATITAPTTAQVFAADTTSTTLSVMTNEPSTCRYSTTDQAYGSMTNTLTGAGSTSHSATLTGLANGGSYTHYVRCSDSTGNAMTTSQSASFSVASSSPAPSVNECATPGQGWLWCDDFEQNRLATPANGGGYFEYGTDGGEFIRVAGTGITSSTAMRALFQQGEVGAGDLKVAFGRTPQAYMQPVAGTAGNDYRDIYWRVYLRHQPGWTGGGGDKLSRATIFANSSWAQAAFGHVWSSSGAGLDLMLDPASGTDTAGTLRTTTYNNFPNMRWLGSNGSDTPIFNTTNVGKWYCIETRMRLNDAGMSNGVFTLWIDNQIEAERAGLNWVGSYDAYGINAIMLENYWNAGSVATQERYFDNFVISTQRIGCAETAPTNNKRIGDLNDDGIVDLQDVILIIANFRRRGNYDSGADINSDGIVNIFDMVLLGRNWGSGAPEPPAEQLTPLFFSDWRTVDTGTSVASLSDNGKLNGIAGGSGGSIIDAPAGFPTSKALLMVAQAANNGYFRRGASGLGVPAIGATRNYRWYYRHDQPNHPLDNNQHPIEDLSARNWAFQTSTTSDTTWNQYYSTASTNEWDLARWAAPPLETGTVYRFELQIHRLSETTWNMHARLYDASGNLLYDDDDYRNRYKNPNYADVSLADTPTLYFSSADIANLGSFYLGLNGIGNISQATNPDHRIAMPYAVQAGFAVVDGLEPNTFIGPYGSVVGEVRP